MNQHFNQIERYRQRLFECQLKAVRDENPNITDVEVLLRAFELHATIVEAENNRLSTNKTTKV